MDEQGSKAMENWVKIQQCLQYNNIVSVIYCSKNEMDVMYCSATTIYHQLPTELYKV